MTPLTLQRKQKHPGRHPVLFGQPVIRVMTRKFKNGEREYSRTILWIYQEAVEYMKLKEREEFLIELVPGGFTLTRRIEKEPLQLVFRIMCANCRSTLQIVTEKFAGCLAEGYYALKSNGNGYTFKRQSNG